MLHYAVLFFLLAVVAAVLGFGGLAGTFAAVAKIMAIAFVVLFVASLIYSLMTGRKVNPPT